MRRMLGWAICALLAQGNAWAAAPDFAAKVLPAAAAPGPAGRGQPFGSIAAGKDADLIVVDGDPSRQIADIEKVETVFKDGTGYNAAALVESVAHDYGRY